MKETHYWVLGVKNTATQEEIKQAFRQRSIQYHPDKVGGDSAKFDLIAKAYSVIGDAKKRLAYDRDLANTPVEDLNSLATELTENYFAQFHN